MSTIAFRIAGLTRRSETGWRTPLAPSRPSRVPSLETRMLARAAPCASRPSRLHEYQKNGPATALPTANAPMSTTTQAAAICSPSFQRIPSFARAPSPIRRPLNVAGGCRGTALAPDQPGEQAALRRRLGSRRLRRVLRQLVLRRQHRAWYRAALALGLDRGVHLVALRLVVHGTQVRRRGRASFRTLAAACASTSTPSRRSRASRAP